MNLKEAIKRVTKAINETHTRAIGQTPNGAWNTYFTESTDRASQLIKI
jgi:hypothetical protein